jgi:hypothetical protein
MFLSSKLKQQKSIVLGEAVEFASRQASTFPATEFLGESKLALRRVLNEENGVLTEQELADLLDVLKQLDKAFDGR